jgi:hypothetical protein
MAFLGRITSVFTAGLLFVGTAWPQRSDSELEDNFHWRPALLQSAFFLGVQHGFRFATEPGSREELKGPFFRDWGRSMKGIRGWGDGDTALVNYVGHPMMGAVTGYVYIQNDPRSRVVPFGTDEYWKSRLRAMAFSTVYSTQWEIGPVSEANLGNVGKAAGTSGAVDFVVTPLAGFGMIALEDAVDLHIVRRLESKWSNRPFRIMVRSLLNPDRAMANLLRFKVPWHRDNRPGVSHQYRNGD